MEHTAIVPVERPLHYRAGMRFKSIPASVRKGWELSEGADAWTELLGPYVTEDVKRLKVPEDGGILLASPRPLLEAPNAFAAVVEQARADDLIERLLQVLTNSYFLAPLPHEGDCLLHHCPPLGHETCKNRETADVVYWSHETGHLAHAGAYDLPTVVRLLEVAESGEDDAKRVKQLLYALDRYALDRWPLSHVAGFLEQDGIIAGVRRAQEGKKRKAAVKPPRTHFALIHDRAVWLAAAFATGRVNKEALAAQHSWTPDAALERDDFAAYPPTALYWLLRSFVLSEQDRFDTIAAATAKSASRLVRDATSYLHENRDALAELRARAAEVLDEITNPFPKSLSLGATTFRRDDAVLPVEAAQPLPSPILPEPADGQQLETNWHEPKLALRLTSGHVLVSGNHRHPRAGKDGSIPNWLSALIEVDCETASGRIVCSIPHGIFESTQAAFLGDERLLLTAGANHLRLYEQHGERLCLVDDARSNQSKVLVVAGGPANSHVIVAYGGSQRMGEGGWANVVDSVELWAVTDGALVQLGRPPLALATAAVRDGGVVSANEDGSVGYRLEGLDEAVEGWKRPGVTFRRSYYRERDDTPTVAPAAVAAALESMDVVLASNSGKWLVLKKQGGDPLDALMCRPSTFAVCVGDHTGIRAVEPELVGVGVFDIIGDAEAMACLHGKVHRVDLATGKAEALFELPAGIGAVETLSNGFCIVVGDELVFWNRAGEQIRRIHTGPGAATIMSLLGGDYVALKTAHSTLVLLAVKGDEVRLVGAVRPDGPLARATFSTPARPAGHYRLLAKVDNRLYQPFGLREAVGTIVADALPSAPWEVAEIAFEPTSSQGAK